MEENFEDYKSYTTLPFKKQQRVHYLHKLGKVRIYKDDTDYYYNEKDLTQALCKKNEIPLTPEEFDSEPFLYYAKAHTSTKKAQYAFKKLSIPKYMNLQTFRACFKLTDIFKVEIRDMANWFSIPEEEIKKTLIDLWKKFGKGKNSRPNGDPYEANKEQKSR